MRAKPGFQIFTVIYIVFYIIKLYAIDTFIQGIQGFFSSCIIIKPMMLKL